VISQDSKITNEKGPTAVTVKPFMFSKEITNMNMPILTQFGNSEQKTMGTREIANLCEKEHFHVKRDLELSEKIINQLIDLEEIKLVIIPSPSGRGKPRNAYFVKGGK